MTATEYMKKADAHRDELAQRVVELQAQVDKCEEAAALAESAERLREQAHDLGLRNQLLDRENHDMAEQLSYERRVRKELQKRWTEHFGGAIDPHPAAGAGAGVPEGWHVPPGWKAVTEAGSEGVSFTHAASSGVVTISWVEPPESSDGPSAIESASLPPVLDAPEAESWQSALPEGAATDAVSEPAAAEASAPQPAASAPAADSPTPLEMAEELIRDRPVEMAQWLSAQIARSGTDSLHTRELTPIEMAKHLLHTRPEQMTAWLTQQMKREAKQTKIEEKPTEVEAPAASQPAAAEAPKPAASKPTASLQYAALASAAPGPARPEGLDMVEQLLRDRPVEMTQWLTQQLGQSHANPHELTPIQMAELLLAKRPKEMTAWLTQQSKAEVKQAEALREADRRAAAKR